MWLLDRLRYTLCIMCSYLENCDMWQPFEHFVLVETGVATFIVYGRKYFSGSMERNHE